MRIVNDAIKTAEQKRKETVIEAKDEAPAHEDRSRQGDQGRRSGASRQERRLDQKERNPWTRRWPPSRRKRSSTAAASGEAKLDELEQLKLRQMESGDHCRSDPGGC